MFFLILPCFSGSSDDRLGSFYPVAAAATARPSWAWCFSCRQLLFFEVSFARGTFSSSTITTIRILRRHVRQFWYLPAAGEAAAAAARSLAAWCFSSADVRDFLGAVLAAAAASNKICRKETLGTLLARFGNYVVLQGHVVFPLAGDFFRACFPAESFHAER